jgi:hypothetical protein
MTPDQIARDLAWLQQVIDVYEGWKRDARKLTLRDREANLAQFDERMDRVIVGARERIAKLNGGDR